MTWNYEMSRTRIERHLDDMGEITIKKLVRDADLQTLLSETNCREIFGAHLYADIPNFGALLAQDPDGDEGGYRQLIQALHLYQREVTRIVEDELGGYRVHFQGGKLHALFYRPIDDDVTIALRAVLCSLVLKEFLKSAFNQTFPDYADFQISSGTDLGNVIGTKNGMRGERETLFLGGAANHAAKIISTGGQLRITQHVYDTLPGSLQSWCKAVDDEYQLLAVALSDLEDALAEEGFDWTPERSRKRLKADLELLPLDDIAWSGARQLIDLDSLSARNNKLVLVASVFGDVAGFTAYIDGATSEVEQRRALRVFHAIRREMSRVVRLDFDGLHVQFQGDRIQGLVHLPADDTEAISRLATEIAVGLQSSMEFPLRDVLGQDAADLKLAVGVDLGITLATKLGERGHRDRICIGEAVERAARHEEHCSGGTIGIGPEVYSQLPDNLKQHFTWDAGSGCYTALDLTADRVARSAGDKLATGAPAYIRTTSGGSVVLPHRQPDARPVRPSQVYAP